ncbi:hypothetical protein PVK06_043391 [Gossypium arboreum]|uniref:RNase H type-1 domain-containing protein n=1 Tax=Gossypium arboreum TaxID=29729 RepID=A0ABR0MNJ3_GOSAR|nr:hypothetical protein PVK06_043391 [Gossypium arboreum]
MVGYSVNEKWIIGGDFNAILDEAEKEGGRRKSTVLMEDFRTIVDELAMVDLKTNNGWFTWVNNREGPARVKERLDHFLISANAVNSFSFLETRVIQQSSSDHDAISLDTEGRRPRDGIKDPRLCFKYDVCWAKNEEAKTIIKEAWQCGSQDTMEKITIMGNELGEVNDKLLKEFTEDEMMTAFNQMDPRKASGIDGRMIHDNILISYEFVHYLQSAKNGLNKGFVMKLDMSKAYDRVEWAFIEENNNLIKGIRAGRNGPRINHLFFADDDLLFVRHRKCDVKKVVNILEYFCKVSGQEVNKDKSMIMFSPKTPMDRRHLFSSMLGMRMVDKLDAYLGLPLPVSRKKSSAFTNIVNRCTCRAKSWSKHLLSYGGKEVFIKAIMQAIPTYAFSVFLALKGIIEEIQSQMSRMWWNNNNKARGWAMAWDKMCYPKGMRGMGFRDLQLFNLALLGRQVWRLMTHTDTLCFKVLSAKYFPEGDVFSYKQGDKPSFTWTSIAKAVDALKDGFLWQVGDGNRIDIRKDHWGVDGIRGDSVCRSYFNHDERLVKDLWVPNNKRWNRERVIKIYGENLGECICKFPISHNGIKDTRVWMQNPHDCQKAREILVTGGLNNRLLEGVYNTCIDWLEDVFRVLDKKVAVDFLTLLWNSWNDRNNMVFNGTMDAAVTIWERAQTLSQDFWIFNLSEPALIPPIPIKMAWKTPPAGYIKVNVDAAVSNGCSGFGAVARDDDGFVLGGCNKFRNEELEASWVELEALTVGIKLVKKLKANQIILESYSATLVNKVNKWAQDITILGQRVRQECEGFCYFNTIQIKWIHRHCNSVANLLCTLASTNKCDLYFDMDYPMEIHNFIIHDAIK